MKILYVTLCLYNILHTTTANSTHWVHTNIQTHCMYERTTQYKIIYGKLWILRTCFRARFFHHLIFHMYVPKGKRKPLKYPVINGRNQAQCYKHPVEF